MKKKIFSLVGALVLTCAMSLNVFAADSPQAVKDAAQGVEMPEDPCKSAELAKELLIEEDSANVEISPLTDVDDQVSIAKQLAELKNQDSVNEVEVVAMFELSGTPGKVVFNVPSTDRETVYAIHIKRDGSSEWLPGDKTADNQFVTFTFTSFSPVAIVKAEHKPTTQQSGNNDTATTPAVTPAPAETTVVNGVTVPAAPKTGDNAVAVAAMAVLFMVGAGIAVSRKNVRKH